MLLEFLKVAYETTRRSQHWVGYHVDRIDKALDGLKVKLATTYNASGGKRVNVISHSMGGLLMLCFLSLHHDVCIIFHLLTISIYPSFKIFI